MIGRLRFSRLGPVAASVLAGVLGAGPGGLGSLARVPEVDRSASAGLLSGAGGVLVIAIGAAAGQKILIRAMQSDKLATIASAGLVLMGVLFVVVVVFGLFRLVCAFVVLCFL